MAFNLIPAKTTLSHRDLNYRVESVNGITTESTDLTKRVVKNSGLGVDLNSKLGIYNNIGKSYTANKYATITFTFTNSLPVSGRIKLHIIDSNGNSNLVNINLYNEGGFVSTIGPSSSKISVYKNSNIQVQITERTEKSSTIEVIECYFTGDELSNVSVTSSESLITGTLIPTTMNNGVHNNLTSASPQSSVFNLLSPESLILAIRQSDPSGLYGFDGLYYDKSRILQLVKRVENCTITTTDPRSLANSDYKIDGTNTLLSDYAGNAIITISGPKGGTVAPYTLESTEYGYSRYNTFDFLLVPNRILHFHLVGVNIIIPRRRTGIMNNSTSFNISTDFDCISDGTSITIF